MKRQKVLIIGLDGFTWTVGKKLIQDGYMPTLGKLVETGCHGDLMSVIPYETSPAWSCFQTGCLPGKTGVFAFHSYYHGQRQIKLNSFQQIRKPSLWELLSEDGKRVISINMPMTSPPPHINGVMVPGLTCPEISRETVYPPEIYERFIKENPNYQIVDNSRKPDLKSYVDSAIQTEQSRCDLALKLMKNEAWDLFSVQIQSTDAFQHKNWWAVDAQAEGFTEEAYLQAAAFYRSIDNVIERLVEAAGESVLTVIVSDHGFCAKKADIGINTWLHQQGYLSLSTPVSAESHSYKDRMKQRFPLVKSLAGLYGRFSKHVSAWRPNDSKRSELYSEKVVRHIRKIIDLEDTFAFCLGGMAGALYITEPSDHEKTQELIQKLLDTYGPDSQEPLIQTIAAVKEIYPDEDLLDYYPDYIISFTSGVESRINPGGTQVVKAGLVDDKRTGTHGREGIYVLHGQDIKSDTRFNADIIDIVPTILASFSSPVPSDLDGNVLTQAFSNGLEVNYGDVKEVQKESPNYSDVDQSIVEKQLEDLGYL